MLCFRYIKTLKASWFLVCLLLLLLNDFYLKYWFPGIITGKLSDFSGLFIFPYFFSVFFYQRKKEIYIITAFLFCLWKLPISSNFIIWFNHLGLPNIGRVEDLSDLLALLILPFSYRYFNIQLAKEITFTRIQVSIICIIAFFSFCATTIGEKEYEKNLLINNTYNFKVSKASFIKSIKQPHINKEDTLFFVTCPVDHKECRNDSRLFYIVTIKTVNEKETSMTIHHLFKYVLPNKGLFQSPDEDCEKYCAELSKDRGTLIFLRSFIDLVKNKVSDYDAMDFNNKFRDYLEQDHLGPLFINDTTMIDPNTIIKKYVEKKDS